VYPVTLQFLDHTEPIAFLSSYISWLNVEREDLLQSRNISRIIQSWHDIAEAAGSEACVVIAFFPSKPQIYLPFVVPEHREQVRTGY